MRPGHNALKKTEGYLTWGHHRLEYFGVTDQGRVRKLNEDDFLIMPEYHLFAVADGMGGHDSGDVASRLTLECLADFLNYLHHPQSTPAPPGLDKETLTKPELVAAIDYANQRVHAEAGDKIMGSTLVIGRFLEKFFQVIHVGDSRAYLFKEERLQPLTHDHSLVFELYEHGDISEAEMRTDPRRNVVTKAIGPSSTVEPSLQTLMIGSGDLLLLCSDGLTGMLSDDEISTTLVNEDGLTQKGLALVNSANASGGKDNITIILIACH